jgi:membrane protease YdiL (CAAX protease family)
MISARPFVSETPSPSPQLSSQQFFIWALVAGILPCFGLPVVWTLAAIGWAKDATSAHRPWRRWLVALAILDTLVAGATVHMAVTKAAQKVSTPASSSARVLGLGLDPDYSGPGVRLLWVSKRSPAAAAGLREGDLVHTVNGQPVDSTQALQAVVRDTPPEVPVKLELEREGVRREVPVVPVDPRTFAPPPTGLFEPREEEAPAPPRWSPRRELIGSALAAGGLILLWALSRKRGGGARPLVVLAVLVAALGGFALTDRGLAALLGGSTRGGALLAMWGQTLVLCVASWVVLARGGAAASPEAPRSWLRTYLLSLGLLITLAPRVLLPLVWLSLLGSTPPEANQHPLVGLVQQGPMGPLGWVLLGIPAALLAPVGEELLFRGLLLPWLHTWTRPVVALVLSAVLFASLHAFYGLFTGWIFFLGLLLGWARLHSGGVLAPILLHITINSFALLMQARTLGG